MAFTTRAAVSADVDRITEIYNQAVLFTTATFDTRPRTVEEQSRWLALHGGAHPVLVAEEGGRVAGWASLSPYSDREAYARTVEISVYVDEDFRRRGAGSELLVSDNGPGILPEVSQQLFSPFFTTKKKGCGLGLALCRKIVHLHGGKIAAESAPGKGATFVIRLPPGGS